MIRRRPSDAAAAPVRALAALCAVSAACAQQPTSVPVRSLERSGHTAFLCLSAPEAAATVPAPVEDCTGDAPLHLYLLATQTTRGEVAVIDVTANAVVDVDPSTPGFNFLPVGAQPTDIVATPGGTAAFVSVAEPGREGIFALPATRSRGGAPRLTDWPACALPVAPGAMTMLVDPPSVPGNASSRRPTCDEPYGTAAPGPPGVDLAAETRPPGTRKIAVTLPDLAAMAIVDAQDLLARAAGSFDPCRIERFVTLRADLPGAPPKTDRPTADGGTCVPPSKDPGPAVKPATPRPAEMALSDDRRLFVSDSRASVVHVVDVSDPCRPVEGPPLLPRSETEPWRPVVTSAVAASPLTRDGKRFVYAVDLKQGSLMVFDATVGATRRTPIVRSEESLRRDPFQPPDRIGFASPVRGVAFVRRDAPNPYVDPSGVAEPVLCNADREAGGADPAGVAYQSSADFATGAGPRNLRGVFAAAVLANGQMVFVDVDDWDAPCRRPRSSDALLGCPPSPKPEEVDGATGEMSCSVVEPHRLRSGAFFTTADVASVGRHSPGLQTQPRLSLNGGVLPTDDSPDGKKHPKILGPADVAATLRASSAAAPAPWLTIGGAVPRDVSADPRTATINWVAFDLREPRVHFDQDWAVAYEGTVGGIDAGQGRLKCKLVGAACAAGQAKVGAGCDCDPSTYELSDPGAGFCGRGVHDRDAALPDPADLFQIVDDLPDEADPYWSGTGGACSYIRCRATFGLSDVPTASRDFPIREAYGGRLVLEKKDVWDATDPAGKTPISAPCCFPYVLRYRVRATGQWVVTSNAVGFQHRTTSSDALGGRCMDSCDPVLSLRNARVRELLPDQFGAGVNTDDPRLFRNAQVQFALWRGSEPSKRDMVFTFRQVGGFVPLYLQLVPGTSLVSPASVRWLGPAKQIVVADGAGSGVVLVDVGAVAVSRIFY